ISMLSTAVRWTWYSCCWSPKTTPNNTSRPSVTSPPCSTNKVSATACVAPTPPATFIAPPSIPRQNCNSLPDTLTAVCRQPPQCGVHGRLLHETADPQRPLRIGQDHRIAGTGRPGLLLCRQPAAGPAAD